MMPEAEDSPLLSGPVTPTLLKMAGPISLGMLSTFLFQVVDTYFVGQLGPNELAALGFSATTYFLAVALFMGMAVGVSALVGKARGEGDRVLSARYATVALGVALAVSVCLSALGLVLLEPTFVLLGATPELIPLIDQYMSTLYFGLPLLIVGLVGGAAIRATGVIAPPEIIMGVAGIINVVFDYLLIFGVGPFPRWGLFGAAAATVLSWTFVAILMTVVAARQGLLTRKPGHLGTELRDIARLSSPAIATQILLPITAALITFLAARSGPAVVAAFGVAAPLAVSGTDVVYGSPSQGEITFGWDAPLVVDGDRQNLGPHLRYDNRFSRVRWGASRAIVERAGASLVLDFDAITRTGS